MRQAYNRINNQMAQTWESPHDASDAKYCAGVLCQVIVSETKHPLPLGLVYYVKRGVLCYYLYSI